MAFLTSNLRAAREFLHSWKEGETRGLTACSPCVGLLWCDVHTTDGGRRFTPRGFPYLSLRSRGHLWSSSSCAVPRPWVYRMHPCRYQKPQVPGRTFCREIAPRRFG